MGSETLDYTIEIEVRIYDRYGDFAVFHHADTEARVSFSVSVFRGMTSFCNLVYSYGRFNLTHFSSYEFSLDYFVLRYF